jgi:hypothetical protein
MQKRRRALLENNKKADEILEIPDQHWQEITDRGLEDITRCSGAVIEDDRTLILEMLSRTLRINISRRHVETDDQGRWRTAPSLPAFVAVVYLAKCQSIPLSGQWVSEKDLSCREFFRGPHLLQTDPVLDKYGQAAAEFLAVAKKYGGVEINETGDAAVRLWVLPSIPIKLVLWCGDEELGPALTVMFDRSIEMLLPGDGIWALVQMVCETLAEQSL